MHRAPAALLVGMLVVAVDGGGTTAAEASADPRQVTVMDLDGRAVQPLGAMAAPTRGAVFVFTRSDCPIANRYAPDLERLQRRAAAASIGFWLVFVDPAESAATIREHLHTYGYTGRALRDTAHDLARASGATLAPEAAVFTADGPARRLVYRGRIDDRYLGPGRMRPTATTHDLEDVIDDLRAGRALVMRDTQAVGCVIADLR